MNKAFNILTNIITFTIEDMLFQLNLNIQHENDRDFPRSFLLRGRQFMYEAVY